MVNTTTGRESQVKPQAQSELLSTNARAASGGQCKKQQPTSAMVSRA